MVGRGYLSVKRRSGTQWLEMQLTVQRENVYQTFRFTRRATRHIVVLGALVPASIALIAYTFDVSLSLFLCLKRG